APAGVAQLVAAPDAGQVFLGDRVLRARCTLGARRWLHPGTLVAHVAARSAAAAGGRRPGRPHTRAAWGRCRPHGSRSGPSGSLVASRQATIITGTATLKTIVTPPASTSSTSCRMAAGRCLI